MNARKVRQLCCLLMLISVLNACSLSDNPRRDEKRADYQRRRSTAFLLNDQKDQVADWDNQLNNDLGDGVDWSQNFIADRSLGGALVFMLSTLDRKVRPREFSVIPEQITVTDAVISAQQKFLFYETKDGASQRYWFGALPAPVTRPYAPNKRSQETKIKPFEILTEGRLSLVNWHPRRSICCYFDSDTRQFLVTKIGIDKTKNQVTQLVLARLQPAIPFINCESSQWTADGEVFLTLWKKPRGRVVAWQFKLAFNQADKFVSSNETTADNDSEKSESKVEKPQIDSSFEAVEFKWPIKKDGEWSVLSLVPNPYRQSKQAKKVIVEAIELSSEDRDKHYFYLLDRLNGTMQPLNDLSIANGFAARWNGRDTFSVSRAQAGLGDKKGGRWREWKVQFYSKAQAIGNSLAKTKQFPVDFAAMDWNTNGRQMDRQLTWLLQGEVAAFIDPDTQRNIVLSDHSGKNNLTLLLDRSRSTAPILSLQVVSVRPNADDPESWRDYLYFIEEGVAGNVKRIDITPIGLGN